VDLIAFPIIKKDGVDIKKIGSEQAKAKKRWRKFTKVNRTATILDGFKVGGKDGVGGGVATIPKGGGGGDGKDVAKANAKAILAQLKGPGGGKHKAKSMIQLVDDKKAREGVSQ